MDSCGQGGQLNPVFELEDNVGEELSIETDRQEKPQQGTSQHRQPETMSALNIPDAGKCHQSLY